MVLFSTEGRRELNATNNPDDLFDRKSAAKYLGGTKPLSPGTLAVWDCTKRYDLKPIKVGRAVRYRRSELDRFLRGQLEK